MRVAVWGAGAVGTPLVYRLATLPCVSEIHWVNRTLDRIQAAHLDLEQGLAFAPTCHAVARYPQEAVDRALSRADCLVVTAGAPVAKGQTRDQVFAANLPIIQSIGNSIAGFNGTVLIVTNPVDRMAREVSKASGLAPGQVMGLGTVVETARLKAALASALPNARPPRDVWAFAVGTHDENFVAVAHQTGLAPTVPSSDFEEILRRCRAEVASAAARVKDAGGHTQHPIVEGVVQVLEAIAYDRKALLTVSSLDPQDVDGLWYSVPCIVGRSGVLERRFDLLHGPDRAALRACTETLRERVRTVP